MAPRSKGKLLSLPRPVKSKNELAYLSRASVTKEKLFYNIDTGGHALFVTPSMISQLHQSIEIIVYRERERERERASMHCPAGALHALVNFTWI
jgi:hypothetical protein